ncbi:hypothetical protein IWW39_005814 [Coemansia spiralis]|uniref:RRM domain-containing protein n=1 Tax=Coemansia spiralis TaxID=417178 RepID=A0A9W8GA69_9FUNG|nr:hypothetical protein IWW39_005814 [Coemansia spiralis]
MVSYTDLSPIKQPAAPVSVGLNDPMPEQLHPPARGKSRKDSGGHGSAEQSDPDEWRRGWEQMHSKKLYFKGVTEDALPELQQLFKTYRGIRLNVDPHDSLEIAGNVEFRNIYDTMVILNNKRLQKDAGTLVLSPLPNAELGQPLNGGYICIKHIPDDASELSLYDLLRPSGPLYSCSFPTTASGQRKGMAHACYVDLASANAAIEQLNFSEYQGNTISMQLSRPPRQSRASTSGSSHSRDSNAGSKSSATVVPASTQRPKPIAQLAENEHRGGDSNAPAPQTFSSPTRSSPHSPSAASATSTIYHQPQQQPQQPGRGVTSPAGAADGPGSGLGGVIVPGKLFVTNLHPTVSHKELFALFKKYGYIQSARVSIEPTTKKSRGHAIVQFSDPTAALDALKECQGADIKGRKITMYQYEHVNKNTPPSLSPRAAASLQEHNSISQASSAPPLLPEGSEVANESASEVPIKAIQANSVPFPRSNSVASSHPADPLLDPVMIRNLSDTSRNEILTQKLISEIASNPAVDVRDASRIVESFMKRPLEDILALLSDPGLLASEWDLEQRAGLLMPFSSSSVASASQDASPTKQAADPSSQTGRDAVGVLSSQLYKTSVCDGYDGSNEDELEVCRKESGGIRVQDYNTETEEYIELLLSKPENERKKKLGSKLFPLIKGMGYKESTKLTVWILDHMSHDVRTMAYTLNDTAKLRDIVNEAQQSLGVTK